MTALIRMLCSDISHMPLHAVWQECGAPERHGFTLQVDVANMHLPTQPFIGMKDRAPFLLEGRYEVLSGLHHDTYIYRAKGDKRFVYLAQAQNDWDDRLVVKPGVTTAADLDGGRVVLNTRAPCVYGNVRQVLRRAGADVDSIEFEIWDAPSGDVSLRAIEAVVSGHAVAAGVDIPFDLTAESRGLKVLDVPGAPVIHNATICTNVDWVRANEELVEGFIKSMVEAIHFFKTNKAETIEILRRRFAPLVGIETDEELAHLQEAWGGLLNSKPYPHPLSIWNVYNLDVAHNPDVNYVSPFEVWDTSILKSIDDSGFIDDLYGGQREAANPAVNAII
jgi:Txe/YoeB family toxin of Txe-Axe toxin-antitoxin module